MQSPPRAQGQKELEGAGDTIQIAKWLEVLRSVDKGWLVCPTGRPRPLTFAALLWTVLIISIQPEITINTVELYHYGVTLYQYATCL